MLFKLHCQTRSVLLVLYFWPNFGILKKYLLWRRTFSAVLNLQCHLHSRFFRRSIRQCVGGEHTVVVGIVKKRWQKHFKESRHCRDSLCHCSFLDRDDLSVASYLSAGFNRVSPSLRSWETGRKVDTSLVANPDCIIFYRYWLKAAVGVTGWINWPWSSPPTWRTTSGFSASIPCS